eukprot:m.204578 g.204578  ORF g.204578 m.204578 type:complete len:90 (+) comp17747_c0_seq1:2173-2442(+)
MLPPPTTLPLPPPPPPLPTLPALIPGRSESSATLNKISHKHTHTVGAASPIVSATGVGGRGTRGVALKRAQHTQHTHAGSSSTRKKERR